MQRILIADDHTVVRAGIRQILSFAFPHSFIEDVSNSEDLLKRIMNEQWNIVISDISMPGRSGLDILKDIRKLHPGLPVLILSMYSEEHYGLRAIMAGASGYLMKEMAAEELVNAVNRLLSGKKYISHLIAEKLAVGLAGGVAIPSHQNLSNRELEIFKLIADGQAICEIALKLSLSSSTIGTYKARIMRKMALKSNADLTRYAFINNLL